MEHICYLMIFIMYPKTVELPFSKSQYDTRINFYDNLNKALIKSF